MSQRPNIIWIFGDQHPAHMLGCAGNPDVHTPNIDLLARRGTRYTQAVGGFPLCCPFRGSLMTSRYPHHAVPAHEAPLPPELPTVADAFKANDYHTAWFGKWHLDGFKEATGRAVKHIIPRERRGRFDDWLGYENNNRQWDTWVHGHLFGAEEPITALPGYETDSLTDRFISYLHRHNNQNGDTPLFAGLSVQPPHDPYWAPVKDNERYQISHIQLRPNVPAIPRVQEKARRTLAGAYAQVSNLDQNVGRIIEALQRTGMLDNTVVFFFSDHGDLHGSHGLWEKHLPYQESINVPMIVCDFRKVDWYPVDSNLTSTPINHVDILPTSLGMAGLTTPDWCAGTDLSQPAINPRGYDPDALPSSAYLQNLSGYAGLSPWRGVITAEGYKYIAMHGKPWKCYHLNEDPYELHNLVEDKRASASWKPLHEELKQWIARTEDDYTLID